MVSATYRTEFFGETIEVRADWAQASSGVHGVDGGYQVADFRHSPKAAMRLALEQYVRASGDTPGDHEDAIEAAVEDMTEADD